MLMSHDGTLHMLMPLNEKIHVLSLDGTIYMVVSLNQTLHVCVT